MEIGRRIDAIDWSAVDADLDHYALGRLGPVLTPPALIELFVGPSADPSGLLRAEISLVLN